jgi:hypothetical protein
MLTLQALSEEQITSPNYKITIFSLHIKQTPSSLAVCLSKPISLDSTEF